MTREEYKAGLSAYLYNLDKQTQKGSTGTFGKLSDEIIRRAILKKGINANCKIGCRTMKQVDVKSVKLGEIEVKTGSGAVAYGDNFSKDDIIAENILPHAKLIVWIPFTQYINADNWFKMAWIFTRDEFIETLEAIGKNGLQSSVKISKHGAQLNIQTIAYGLEARLWDIIETMPTVAKMFDCSDIQEVIKELGL